MEELSQCPICLGNKFNPFISCLDYTVSHETFHIVRCEGCGFRFTNPRPDEKEIAKYYQSEEYISHSGTNRGVVNKIYGIVRNYTIKQKVKIVNQLASGCSWAPENRGTTRNLLDFGCGTGEFLNACKQDGWNVCGIEPSEIARKQSEKKFGISNFTSLQALSSPTHVEYGNGLGFNVITLWHVFEHIHQPERVIKQFYNILYDDGLLIIAVPNCNSYDAKKYGEYWAAYDLPRHLYHFTKKDIESLMEKQGFKLSGIIPMKFDSYYISLLSERNKTGRTKLFKGFCNGRTSNIFSKKNNIGYSSQIYVFRKIELSNGLL